LIRFLDRAWEEGDEEKFQRLFESVLRDHPESAELQRVRAFLDAQDIDRFGLIRQLRKIRKAQINDTPRLVTRPSGETPRNTKPETITPLKPSTVEASASLVDLMKELGSLSVASPLPAGGEEKIRSIFHELRRTTFGIGALPHLEVRRNVILPFAHDVCLLPPHLSQDAFELLVEAELFQKSANWQHAAKIAFGLIVCHALHPVDDRAAAYLAENGQKTSSKSSRSETCLSHWDWLLRNGRAGRITTRDVEELVRRVMQDGVTRYKRRALRVLTEAVIECPGEVARIAKKAIFEIPAGPDLQVDVFRKLAERKPEMIAQPELARLEALMASKSASLWFKGEVASIRRKILERR
jgi:hypothetical protein